MPHNITQSSTTVTTHNLISASFKSGPPVEFILAKEGDSVSPDEGWLVMKDGIRLSEQCWLPPTPKAAVILVHGYAEHVGRYAHVARMLAAQSYAVYGYDQRSHGRSGGQNTFIHSFDALVEDLADYVGRIQVRIGDLPLFILGHSMGGLVTCLYLTQQPLNLTGAILSGPYVTMMDRVHPVLTQLAGVVGTVAPKLPTIQVRYQYITHDADILAQHKADPFIYRGKMPARTGSEIVRGLKKIRGCMETIQTRLFIVHGGDDRIAPIAGSHELMARVGSKDKTLSVYDGLYHEVLHEIKRDQVTQDIIAWMDKRYA